MTQNLTSGLIMRKKLWQKSLKSMELNRNRKAHMKNIWMFIILKRKVTIQYPVNDILIFRQNRENKISVSSSF